MQVTPQYIVSIDSMIKTLITSNWQRIANESGDWGRLMKTRPSSTRRELMTFIADTAGIYPQGQGGDVRIDDMSAVEMEVDNVNQGAGLEFTTNELEDNQLARQEKIGAMDYAQKWARDRGAEAASFPLYGLTGLITATSFGGQPVPLAYDGAAFYGPHHIDPSANSGPTYTNIITGVGIQITPSGTAPQSTYLDAVILAQRNFASACAQIRAQKFINGKSRRLRPAIVVAPAALEYSVNQFIGGGGILSGGSPAAETIGQTSNVMKKWGFQEPIILPELDAISTSTYYIGVEDMVSDELGAFIFSDRKPFELRGYPDASSAELNRSDKWEWSFKGRNAFAYGHPYMFYQCTV